MKQGIIKEIYDLAEGAQGCFDLSQDEALEKVDLILSEFYRLEASLRAIRDLVDEQANDEGLWFYAHTAPEGYLQAALRKLAQVIEENTPSSAAGQVDEKTAAANASDTVKNAEWLKNAPKLVSSPSPFSPPKQEPDPPKLPKASE